MGEKRLLFEAMMKPKAYATTYFYIEQLEDFYFFKYGLSKSRSTIERQHDNRLTIITKSKEKYDKFKNEILEQNKLQGLYSDDNAVYYFKFFDDSDINHNALNIPDDDIGHIFYGILNKHFTKEAAIILQNCDDIVIKDEFLIQNDEIVVFHDQIYAKLFNTYPDPLDNYYSYNALSQENKNRLNDVRKIFGDVMTLYETDYGKKCLGKTIDYLDLMNEYMWCLDHDEMPENPIAVDGWTALDLKQYSQMYERQLPEAYGRLAMLKTHSKEARTEIRQVVEFQYPYLYKFIYVCPNGNIAEDTKASYNASFLKEDDILKTDNKFPLPFNSPMENKATMATKEQYFLSNYTAKTIYSDLKKYVIGQDEMVKSVAEYIYYHMLRQLRPELKTRPLLIAGPSGSGKTEIWRAAKKLYKDYFKVHVVDGTTFTQEGYKGDRKLSSYLLSVAEKDILVVDEFDKLAAPSYTSQGENVGQSIQSEFLKLLEGEYYIDDIVSNVTSGTYCEINFDLNKIGIVLIGSFDTIRHEKNRQKPPIGFKENNTTKIMASTLQDEDLINFGLLPELVGRIADRCVTDELTQQDFLHIIKNGNSRIGILCETLKSLNIDTSDTIDDKEILALAKAPETAKMGVRWVQSKVEKKLIDLLMGADLRKEFEN